MTDPTKEMFANAYSGQVVPITWRDAAPFSDIVLRAELPMRAGVGCPGTVAVTGVTDAAWALYVEAALACALFTELLCK